MNFRGFSLYRKKQTAILWKIEVEAYQILENIALNNCQWPTEREVPKKVVGVHDLDAVTNLTAEISSLSKKLLDQHIWSKLILHCLRVAMDPTLLQNSR